MSEFTLPISVDDHYSNHRQSLISFRARPAYYARPNSPTHKALTSEVILGEQHLIELSYLENDWDGYGGEAIGSEVINASKQYFAMLVDKLPAPDIQPNSNGTISFEWDAPRGIAQLEIGSSKLSLYIKTHIGEPIFVSASSSLQIVADIGLLIHSTLFARQQTVMTVATSFGRNGDGIAF